MVNGKKCLTIASLFCAALLACFCARAQAADGVQPYQKVLEALKQQVQDFSDPINSWKYSEKCSDNCLNPDYDGGSWKTSGWGQMWHGDKRTVYFKKNYKVPEKIANREVAGSKVFLYVRCEDDAYVYVNGELSGSIHRDGTTYIADNVKPGQIIRITMSIKNKQALGIMMKTTVRYSKLDEVQNRTDAFVAQIESVANFADVAKDPQKFYDVVNKAAAKVDLDAFAKLDDTRYIASLDTALKDFDALAPEFKQYDAYLTGYSHIDLCWLWDMHEGEDVVRNTANTILTLMKEYPEFIYTQGQAHTYRWMERDYPDIFNQIKQRVAEGRWEITGGAWVEPDSNLPSGESFVRQFLYGKRYFREKFNKDIIVGWTPDSFGYNWNLPQVRKKAGMIRFLTQKLNSNDTIKYPYKIFWWEGADGTKLLTYFPVGGYGEAVQGPTILDQLKVMMSKNNVKENYVIFGVGDHGGGVTREHLNRAKTLDASPAFPKIHYVSSEQYFKHLAELVKNPEVNVPTWNDELYLQYHRGTYTTQANNKKNNRKSEIMMESVEKFSSIASDAGYKYPSDTIEDNWTTILFNQFHDILPGSSINPVYLDSARDYEKVFAQGDSMLNGALDTIAADVKTAGDGLPLILFNPLSWQRDGVVEIAVPGITSAVQVIAPDGSSLPCQMVTKGTETRLLFVARGVPAVGYATYRIFPNGGVKEAPKPSLSASDTVLENEFIKATLDKETGLLISVIDKRNGNRELLDTKNPSNLIQMYDDYPEHDDAWEIKLGAEKPVNLFEAPVVTERGPVRVTVRVTFRTANASFKQNLSLIAGMPMLYERVDADWHEEHKMAKMKFNFSVKNDTVWYDIPYAAIPRKSIPVEPLDKTKTEHCGQKWADFSDASGDFGVTILNTAKYGYDATGSTIRLSLLRAPMYPDPYADRGQHEMEYAFMPHTGDWKDSHAPRAGYEFNYALIPVLVAAHEGKKPATFSYYSMEPKNAILSVVKKAEDDSSVVLRIFEAEGRDNTTATIDLPFTPKSISEINLIEDAMTDGNPGTIKGNTIVVPLKKFEIKTIKVKK